VDNLFLANEYEVSTMVQTLPDGSARLIRTLTLYSVQVAHDLYNQAELVFDSALARQGTDVPQATVDYEQVRPGVHHIKARLPLSEFEPYYNIVRREAPIGVGFEEKEQGGSRGSYRLVRLSTNREPTGEGDADGWNRPIRRG
jgi:hypothetical protein